MKRKRTAATKNKEVEEIPLEQSEESEVSDDGSVGSIDPAEDAASEDSTSDSSELNTDEEIEASRTKKKKTKQDPAAFATSMSKILHSHLPRTDKEAPILSRSKHIEAAIEQEEIEKKRQRVSRFERKLLEDRDRVRDVQLVGEYEKTLKKVAQKGVVKLFNAIKASQHVVEATVDAKGKPKKEATSMSKSTFLDLIKSGGKVTV